VNCLAGDPARSQTVAVLAPSYSTHSSTSRVPLTTVGDRIAPIGNGLARRGLHVRSLTPLYILHDVSRPSFRFQENPADVFPYDTETDQLNRAHEKHYHNRARPPRRY
jgi:hypothetical protein